MDYQLTHRNGDGRGRFFGRLGSLGGVLTSTTDLCFDSRWLRVAREHWSKNLEALRDVSGLTDLFCQLRAVTSCWSRFTSTTLFGFCVPVLSREYSDSCKTELESAISEKSRRELFQSLIPAPVFPCITQPSRADVRTLSRLPSRPEKRPRPSPLMVLQPSKFGTTPSVFGLVTIISHVLTEALLFAC